MQRKKNFKKKEMKEESREGRKGGNNGRSKHHCYKRKPVFRMNTDAKVLNILIN